MFTSHYSFQFLSQLNYLHLIPLFCPYFLLYCWHFRKTWILSLLNRHIPCKISLTASLIVILHRIMYEWSFVIWPFAKHFNTYWVFFYLTRRLSTSRFVASMQSRFEFNIGIRFNCFGRQLTSKSLSTKRQIMKHLEEALDFCAACLSRCFILGKRCLLNWK